MSEHPELDGYEPYESKPLRSPRLVWAMRIIVVVGVLSLVLPGLITTVSVGSSNAERACAYRVASFDRTAGYDARFEVFGPGGLGWECYATYQYADDAHVSSMGLIPVAPAVRPAPGTDVVPT